MAKILIVEDDVSIHNVIEEIMKIKYPIPLSIEKEILM